MHKLLPTITILCKVAEKFYLLSSLALKYLHTFIFKFKWSGLILQTRQIITLFYNHIFLTGYRKSSRRLAISSHEGHFSWIIYLAVSNCERVLSEHAGNRNAWIFLQFLPIAGPVCIWTWMLQLHTEYNCVTDRYYCPPRKLLSDVTWDI